MHSDRDLPEPNTAPASASVPAQASAAGGNRVPAPAPRVLAGSSNDALSAATLRRVVRDIWNPVEMKVVLTVAALGGLRMPVSETSLIGDADLLTGVRGDGSSRAPIYRIAVAIDVAVARGVLLRLIDEDGEHWLLVSTDETLLAVRNGLRMDPAAVSAGDTAAQRWSGTLHLERPGIFGVYEQNIGLVTPLIADRLVDALQHYPERWIIDAIEEAVAYNRRNWRYIQRILENWSAEGRGNETNRGDSAGSHVREKHLRGKYAHLFERGRLPDL